MAHEDITYTNHKGFWGFGVLGFWGSSVLRFKLNSFNLGSICKELITSSRFSKGLFLNDNLHKDFKAERSHGSVERRLFFNERNFNLVFFASSDNNGVKSVILL